MILAGLLAACTSASSEDSTTARAVVARIVYEGGLPDCALGPTEAALCAREGPLPGTQATPAQQNLVPDWFWRRGEPAVVSFAAGNSTDGIPCAETADAALDVHAAERASSVEYVTGTDEADPRWIDVLLYDIDADAMRYRVPRCAVFDYVAHLGRLRFADAEDLDPAWVLREPPASDDASRHAALYDALDLARIVESHRATIAEAGSDHSLLYAVGTELVGDVARYRTCRVESAAIEGSDGWKHPVIQVDYRFDLTTGRATLDQENVATAVCAEPIGYGVW